MGLDKISGFAKLQKLLEATAKMENDKKKLDSESEKELGLSLFNKYKSQLSEKEQEAILMGWGIEPEKNGAKKADGAVISDANIQTGENGTQENGSQVINGNVRVTNEDGDVVAGGHHNFIDGENGSTKTPRQENGSQYIGGDVTIDNKGKGRVVVGGHHNFIGNDDETPAAGTPASTPVSKTTQETKKDEAAASAGQANNSVPVKKKTVRKQKQKQPPANSTSPKHKDGKGKTIGNGTNPSIDEKKFGREVGRAGARAKDGAIWEIGRAAGDAAKKIGGKKPVSPKKTKDLWINMQPHSTRMINGKPHIKDPLTGKWVPDPTKEQKIVTKVKDYLTPQQMAQLKACKNANEMIALLKKFGINMRVAY